MDTHSLIARSQAGDRDSLEDLFRIIRDEHMPRRVERHYRRNVLVEPAAIDSEFLYGAFLALPRAKLDIGSPLAFMLWKGDMKVADLFKTRVERGVVAQCRRCESFGRILMRAGRPTCRACGSAELETHMWECAEANLNLRGSHSGKVVTIEALAATPTLAVMDAVWSTATCNVQIAEIQRRLNGRARQLFDLIVIEEVNRETSKNYVLEIAQRWGVSTAAVSTYLRKVRAVVTEYLETGY